MSDGTEVSAEDLKAFLQEANEQIQLLDEDIIRLERETDNVDLLQEIFRAAHTLKGSSGMLGFQQMTNLTHAMEDVLDKLRKGGLSVDGDLVDALLQALDGLKVLTEGVDQEGEGNFDIAPSVVALRFILERADSRSQVAGAGLSLQEAIAATKGAAAKLTESGESGLAVFRVVVTIDKGTDWGAVRFFQVLNDLSTKGEVVVSVPSQEEIEAEKAGSELRAVFLTSQAADEFRPGIEAVEDVQSVTVEPWEGSEPVSEDRPDRGEDRRVINLGREARGKGVGDQLEMAATKIETLQTIRIDVDRVDELMNMVGELVIDRTRLDQLSRDLQKLHGEDGLIGELAATSRHIVKVVDELNESMMQVRMLPVGTLFNKFPRLVRDLARGMGKSVDFVMEGQDTEIDRSVIEKIKDPLVHLLRNAIDHGVEIPEKRRAAGKPETARVLLSARHDQGYIVMTIQDDGNGIDVEAIKETAVKRGIISAKAAERMTEAEALDLIFESGLSTAKETTEVSGRGVGMDVVSRDIQSVNGMVKVESQPGEGTTFTLRLPLTLASFQGLLVESANNTYAIPLSYVKETVVPEPKAMSTVMGKRVLNLRGAVLPVMDLAEACGMAANGDSERGKFIVVVQAGDSPVAVAVDALVEQQEIVVKSLGERTGQSKGIAGASIMGDGKVVLILDVAALMKSASQANSNGAQAGRRAL
ncbi:MAG: chemotaxis protein CheA [Chloroflexi bacterium]|nr:chemotaxis protein CheA [Chloroflexota bacterium]